MEIKAPDFKTREDKLTSWLDGEARQFLFDSFSDDYCSRMGMLFLQGVEMPIKAEDLKAFHGEGGLSITTLADNIAIVIGSNTQFKHRDAYIQYLKAYFNENLVEVLAQSGASELVENRYRKACIYFRAALLLDGGNRNAMFGYACCCREWYLSMEGEDDQQLIAILKAEATEYFEHLTRLYPEDAAAYYFLGYAYLNQGLYTKSQLIWKKFLELSKDESKDEVKEIKERLDSLVEPVKIEEGINHLIAGRYEEGLKILEPYVESEYTNWWPLHFYLASGYEAMGWDAEAIEGYRRVLRLNPSNIDACEALADLYASAGDADNADKYLKKSQIIRRNAEN
ncbi:MAG: hypothetical protein MJ186_08025 [Clostridia bacterium]|nr:hypothetical protein [Clostridia bacterium]